jgi:DNA-binding HxlR family transcriptional regulator
MNMNKVGNVADCPVKATMSLIGGKGKSLLPVIELMKDWGVENIFKQRTHIGE